MPQQGRGGAKTAIPGALRLAAVARPGPPPKLLESGEIEPPRHHSTEIL
jgi:hypothetical protein